MPDARGCLVRYLQGLDAERSIASAIRPILQGIEPRSGGMEQTRLGQIGVASMPYSTLQLYLTILCDLVIK